MYLNKVVNYEEKLIQKQSPKWRKQSVNDYRTLWDRAIDENTARILICRDLG